MDEVDVVGALERLFAATSAEDVARLFRDLPWLASTDIRQRLLLDQQTAIDSDARRVADVRLALWEAAAQGDYDLGWAVYERTLLELVQDGLIPRSEGLLARMEDCRNDGDWGGLAEAGRALLLLAQGGPPALEYEGLRAIAQASFADTTASRAESLEAAIRCWERMLAILDHHRDLDDEAARAVALTNLGTALGARLRGDPRTNQERAIRYQRAALELMSAESDGYGWAMAQTNLGLSLLNHASELRAAITDPRELGLPDHDLDPDPDLVQADAEVEEAIEHFEAALTWRSFERDPYDWGFTVTNLGLAYTRRRTGERRSDLESAITQFREGERGFRAAGDRHLQAIALHDLASELLSLANLEGTPEEERQALLREALTSAEAAAAARSLEMAPIETGRALSLQGDILVALGRPAEAASIFRVALTSLTPANAPRLCRKAASRLAELAISEDDWPGAADAWEIAAEAATAAFALRATSSRRMDELSQNLNIHRWAAFAATRAGRPHRAVELLESGRSRELSGHLDARSDDLILLHDRRPALAERYAALRESMNVIEGDARSGLAIPEEEAARMAEELADVVDEIRGIDGLQRFLRTPLFEEVVASVRPAEALVYLLTSPQGSLGLIVTAGLETVRVVEVPELTSTDAFRAYLVVDSEEQTAGGYYLAHRADAEALDAALSAAATLLAEPLLRPVSERLRALGIGEICLIPIALLGLLPLHALLWTEATSPRCLLDDFVTTYAPSASVREACIRRARSCDGAPRRLLVVANPSSSAHPLPGAEFEARAIADAFPADEVILLERDNAMKAVVREAITSATHAHLACHGAGAVFGQPFEASILLAHDEVWTAAEILDGPQLEARLVVASACETGVIQGGTSVADEAISLATVFLGAGAAACIATLWSVNDYATALLMTRFYESLSSQTVDAPAAALREAELWLRDLTDEAEAAYVSTRSALSEHTTRGLRVPGSSTARPERPFASPVYWAPFVFSGA